MAAYDTDLQYISGRSFDTGTTFYSDSKSYYSDSGFIEKDDLVFLRSSQNSLKLFFSNGTLKETASFDGQTDSQFRHSSEMNYFLFFNQIQVTVQSFTQPEYLLVVKSNAGEKFLGCSLRPRDPDLPQVLTISYEDSTASLIIRLLDLISGEEVATKTRKAEMNQAFEISTGLWTGADKFVIGFKSGSNPMVFGFEEVYTSRFVAQNYGALVSLSRKKGVCKILNGGVLLWNSASKKWEAYGSNLIIQEKMDVGIPAEWEAGGLCVSTTNQSYIAILNRKELFFESWKIEGQKRFKNALSSASSNMIVKMKENENTQILALSHGTDAKYRLRASGYTMSSTNCKYLKEYSFKIAKSWIFGDIVSPVMLGMLTDQNKLLVLHYSVKFCVYEENLIPVALISEFLNVWMTKESSYQQGHNHRFLFNKLEQTHYFNALEIKPLKWAQWSILKDSPVSLKLIDHTFRKQYDLRTTLTILTPVDFVWIPRSTNVVVAETSRLIIFLVSNLRTASSTLSASLTIGSVSFTTLKPVSSSNYVVAAGEKGETISIFDYQLAQVKLYLVLDLPYHGSTFQMLDAERGVVNYQELFLTTTHGGLFVDMEKKCSFPLTQDSSWGCHGSCKTCSGTTIRGCLTCFGNCDLDSDKGCRKHGYDNKLYKYYGEITGDCDWHYNGQKSSSCVFYIEWCYLETPQKIWDISWWGCYSKCNDGNYRFDALQQVCTTDSYQYPTTTNYKNSVYWGGPEVCILGGVLAIKNACNSNTCLSQGTVTSGLRPYCEDNCSSSKVRGDLLKFYGSNSNKCYSAFECPSSTPYALSTSNVCSDDCSAAESILLNLGDSGECFSAGEGLGCGGSGLFWDKANDICTEAKDCPASFPYANLVTGECGSESDKSKQLYLDKENQKLVGESQNCIFGSSLFANSQTNECITMSRCLELGGKASLATRECSFSTCPGSESDGICCSTVNLNGCALDGVSECSLECLPFSCFGADSSECCHSHCRTCSGDQKSDCLSCFGGHETFSEGRCCHDTCSTCSGPTQTECLSCVSHHFINPVQSVCQSCHSSCSSCSSGTAYSCLSCLDGSFYHASDNHCGSCHLSASLFSDGSNCLQCHSSCLTCSSELKTDCIECKAGLYFHESDNHCGACHSEESMFLLQEKCMECHSTCLTCSNASESECLSCRDGLLLHTSDKHCSPECETENGYFINTSALNSQSCIPCHPDCLQCTESSNKNCILCKNEESKIHNSDSLCKPCLKFLTPDRLHCSDNCPDPTIPLNSYGLETTSFPANCTECDPSCETCSTMTSMCNSCYSESVLQLSDMICSGSCPEGQYAKNLDDFGHKKCSYCHDSCRTCSGSNETNCISCYENSVFYPPTNKCLLSCPEGWFIPSDSNKSDQPECSGCHSSCKTCQNVYYNCTSCKETQRLFQNQCLFYTCEEIDPTKMSYMTLLKLLNSLGCSDELSEALMVQYFLNSGKDPSAIQGVTSIYSLSTSSPSNISIFLTSSWVYFPGLSGQARIINQENKQVFLNEASQINMAIKAKLKSSSEQRTSFENAKLLSSVRFLGDVIQINAYNSSGFKLEVSNIENPILIFQKLNSEDQINFACEGQVIDAVFFDPKKDLWHDEGVFIQEITIKEKDTVAKEVIIGASHLSLFAIVTYKREKLDLNARKTSLELLKNPFVLMQKSIGSSTCVRVIFFVSTLLLACTFISYFADSSRMTILFWCIANHRRLTEKDFLVRIPSAYIRLLFVNFIIYGRIELGLDLSCFGFNFFEVPSPNDSLQPICSLFRQSLRHFRHQCFLLPRPPIQSIFFHFSFIFLSFSLLYLPSCSISSSPASQSFWFDSSTLFFPFYSKFLLLKNPRISKKQKGHLGFSWPLATSFPVAILPSL